MTITFEELVEQYPPSDGWEVAEDADDDLPFVLIEASIYDGGHWLTRWVSLDAAADYHDGQEYPDDWDIVEVVDLSTGDRYQATTRTIFTEHDG